MALKNLINAGITEAKAIKAGISALLTDVADSNIVRQGAGVISDIAEGAEGLATDGLVKTLNNSSDSVIYNKHLYKMYSEPMMDGVFHNMDRMEEAYFFARNPEILNGIDFTNYSKQERKRITSAIVSKFGQEDKIDKSIVSAYNRGLLQDYGWQKSGSLDFVSLTPSQQQRVMDDTRGMISKFKEITTGSATSDISTASKFKSLNDVQRTEWNKKTIGNVKDSLFEDLDKWASKQGTDTHQKAVNAYKGYVQENYNTGAKNIYNMESPAEYMQRGYYALTPDETKGAPEIARQLSKNGINDVPDSNKNKKTAFQLIKKHPAVATGLALGTLWGVSELAEEDWS